MSWMVRSKAEEKAVFIVPSILARVEIYEHYESVRKLSSMPNPAVNAAHERTFSLKKTNNKSHVHF